ncbi:hypothetical protein CMI46_03230, partial [Candidatus Pacearchaeota archaeon]|nr:hypothetical protein [Candidatus Pacearchaeota archaeon]
TLTIVLSILVILAAVVITVNLFGDKIGLSPGDVCYPDMDGKYPNNKLITEAAMKEFNGACEPWWYGDTEWGGGLLGAPYCRKTETITGSGGKTIKIGECVRCKDDSNCGPLRMFTAYYGVPREYAKSPNNKKCITEDDRYACGCKKNSHCEKDYACVKRGKTYGKCEEKVKCTSLGPDHSCRDSLWVLGEGFKCKKKHGILIENGKCPRKRVCCKK